MSAKCLTLKNLPIVRGEVYIPTGNKPNRSCQIVGKKEDVGLLATVQAAINIGLIKTIAPTKTMDFVCSTNTFPITIDPTPVNYVTLPEPLPENYYVEVEFDSGYIKWVWDGTAWITCSRDFANGGSIQVGN